MPSSPSESPYPDSPRREMLAFVPRSSGRVLDVGCHTGAFGAAMRAELGAEVWGLEISPAPAARASQLLNQVHCGPFDASAPLPDGHFDAIVFNDVLEHFVDPWAALRLARSKLRPGGCVVASIPNVRNFDNLVHLVLDADFRYEDTGIRDRTHVRFFTKKSMVDLFESSGYEVQSIQGINENWWQPSLYRRVAFKLFRKRLADTKFLQFAVVATPKPAG